jgi:hypothetical protein
MCPCHPASGEFAYALLAAAGLLIGLKLMRRYWATMGPGMRAGGILGVVALIGLLGFMLLPAGNLPLDELEAVAGARTRSARPPGEPTMPADDWQQAAILSPEEAADTAAIEVVTPPAGGDANALPAPTIVYYFHRTIRCYACLQIEQLARQAIEQRFPAEIADGYLVWQVVNMEEPGNEHFVEEYALYAPAVILLRPQDGAWKTLEGVWRLLEAENLEAFANYVNDELFEWLYHPNEDRPESRLQAVGSPSD